jgi:choline-sulfatase
MAREHGYPETEPLPAADGQSLWKTLQGRPDAGRAEETFSEHLGGIDGVPSRMVRRGPWKLYKYHDSTPPVMYNLEQDPEEMIDLGTDPRHEGLRNELLKRLYDGWDPDEVLLGAAVLERDLRLVTRWGQAVQPRHEDTLPVPDVEDIEIL